MLIANQLTLIKGKCTILRSVSLQCPKGSITLLLGKSGAGKSSLLRCLAQVDAAEGSVSCEGALLRDLPPRSRARLVSFISQSYALFPHLTVLENCAQPLRVVCKADRAVAKSCALETLALLGMDSYASSYPQQLSGGQQQRVAIARALAINPAFFLFDEPTSALDPYNSATFIKILQTLCGAGKGVVISTQDMAFASQILEHAYLLEEGAIVDHYPTSLTGPIFQFLEKRVAKS